uniref:Rhodopsin n=1 Tax=Panagrolaimus sp. ES5 TaxID=591445 RepID=A0AC34FV71_9BILA
MYFHSGQGIPTDVPSPSPTGGYTGYPGYPYPPAQPQQPGYGSRNGYPSYGNTYGNGYYYNGAPGYPVYGGYGNGYYPPNVPGGYLPYYG